MIRLLLCLSFLISALFAFGDNLDTLNYRLTNGEQKIKDWEERLNKLENSNYELQVQLNTKESQFKLYEVLLEKYENSRSSLIAEFSIFIGVLSLIFGLVGYFVALRPAQESKKEIDRLLEKLQINIDELFANYLKNNRYKLVNNYLKVLLEKNQSETSNAIHYLNSVKHEGFSSEQLFKMRKIVLEDDYDITYQIFTNMIFTKDEIVENTCTEILKSNQDDVKTYALIYFAKHSIHKYDNLVIDTINKMPDEWPSIIASIRSSSEDYLIKLWDEYFNNLSLESITKIASTLNYYKGKDDKAMDLFLEKIKKSKFGNAKKNEELKSLFLNSKTIF